VPSSPKARPVVESKRISTLTANEPVANWTAVPPHNVTRRVIWPPANVALATCKENPLLPGDAAVPMEPMAPLLAASDQPERVLESKFHA
jgi:hypothetical protein